MEEQTRSYSQEIETRRETTNTLANYIGIRYARENRDRIERGVEIGGK